MREQFREKFWSRVDKNGPIHPILKTRCWLWTGAFFQGRDGPEKQYGQVYVSTKDGGKNQGQPAHRVALMMETGELGDLQALHHCDNPPCCRPDHLFRGTHEDNMSDKSSKLRQVRGETDGNSRFTEADIILMRELHAGGASLSQVAEEFNTSKALISLVVRGVSWAHAGGPTRTKHAVPPPARLPPINEEQQQQVVQRYAAGGITMQSLADEYGASLTFIYSTIRGKR